ncbi:MAG: hypothetical protein F6K35_44865, partial [Okeania sp. SIO2H7]|nr:hypothetical protein [Okeania sp. SIO2H7]
IESRDRDAWLNAVEQRFRYLAADGIAVLRGKTQQVSYRQALIKVCRYLKIPYSQKLSTTDLEAEVFLHLVGRACKRLPANELDALTVGMQRSLSHSKLSENLPISAKENPLGLLVKGGSALALTSIVKPILLQQLARQFAVQFAKYQVAKEALIKGGATAATQLQSLVTVNMAKRGMALSAARYGAARSVLGFLGPAIWTWFFADLGWKSISTNYSRIIPTIFALAQIRLLRSEECWEFA